MTYRKEMECKDSSFKDTEYQVTSVRSKTNLNHHLNKLKQVLQISWKKETKIRDSVKMVSYPIAAAVVDALSVCLSVCTCFLLVMRRTFSAPDRWRLLCPPLCLRMCSPLSCPGETHHKHPPERPLNRATCTFSISYGEQSGQWQVRRKL